MNAQNLADLYKVTQSSKFRVRDTVTLEDSFIVEITTYFQSIPSMFSGVKLNGKSFTRILYSGRDRRYALLSSPDECKYWRNLNETQAVYRVKRSYHLAGI